MAITMANSIASRAQLYNVANALTGKPRDSRIGQHVLETSENSPPLQKHKVW